MNPLTLNEPRKTPQPDCTDVSKAAGRELTAFFRAVTELFGFEQAELAAADWLRELEEMDRLPDSIRAWQWITVKASIRLANRLNPSTVSTESQVLRRKRVCVFSSQVAQVS